jgi:hypothetical protein
VDFAKNIPYYLDAGGWGDRALDELQHRLAATPCHASGPSDRVVFPFKKAPELLAAKWAG